MVNDMTFKKPEILAPAGDPEKLRAAVAFGADAVYLAGERFGMRSAAGNFTESQLKEAVAYAHAKDVKVYVTVNTMPRTGEYGCLEKYLLFLRDINIDALIISDLGVFTLARGMVPEIPVHISTQASTVSAQTCAAWHRLGAARIVLARELSLAEIMEIRDNIPPSLELEVFVHGSMCVAYSGRCLLSAYLNGRDANRGACSQPCRWEYTLYSGEIEEVKRKGERFTLVEEAGETYTFSSRDLCMIDHIPELASAGISSFKIEGRMKSVSYAAAVTGAYRAALDSYFDDPEGYRPDPAWRRELEAVCHRQYSTGFYFGEALGGEGICSEPGYIREQAALAVAVGYDPDKKRAFFRQKNKFSAGETVELLIPGKGNYVFTPYSIYGENGELIESTPHPMMSFSLDIPFEVPEYSILRYAGSDISY